MDSPTISIVIPALNEAPSLPLLMNEIRSTMGAASYEVLLIDDGSTDGTREVMVQLCRKDDHIRGFFLNRHAGKGGALAVGIHHAHGKTIIMMDADLQNDPKDIPLLLAALAGGADMALGWRQDRKDPSGKRWASALFNRICTWAFGKRLHDANTGLKAMRREALTHAPLHGGLYRFLPHIVAARGGRVAEVPVHHRPRTFGKTKFSLLHRLKGIPDLLLALVAARAQTDSPLPPHTKFTQQTVMPKDASVMIST